MKEPLTKSIQHIELKDNSEVIEIRDYNTRYLFSFTASELVDALHLYRCTKLEMEEDNK